MTKFGSILVRCLFLLLLVHSWAHATRIEYTSTQLSAERWRYDYTVHNDTLGIPLQEFTIYFQEGLFANLVDTSTPGAVLAGWDVLLIQPDTGIPAPGFVDALGLAGGIAAGQSLGGLSITFDYLGQGGPGSQLFSIVDPLGFNELDAGQTVEAAAPAPVPEPGSPVLFALGLVLAAGVAQRRRQGGVQ